MKDKKEQGLQEFLASVYLFFSTPIIVGFSTWLIRESSMETLRNSILSILMTGLLLFAFEVSKNNDDFLFENREHLLRMCVFYTFGLLASVGGALIPELMIPVLSFGLLFYFMTNLSMGVCGYLLFCVNLTLLSGADSEIFIYYFLTGILAIELFHKRNARFRIILPVLIITMMSVVSLMALYILNFYELTPELIINPSVGIVLNIFILCIALRIVGRTIVHPYDEKYIEINDPEYNLLSQLKEHDKAAYYQAIHTAYLSDRIADKLGAERKLAKGGGYYHKIGLLRSKNFMSKNNEIGMEYGFPPELMGLLNEAGGKDCFPVKKETAIVIMADAVVTSILFLLKKDASMKIDYDQVIDVVFKKKLENGILKCSKLEFGEYYQMKQYFKEEELYYDFLR